MSLLQVFKYFFSSPLKANCGISLKLPHHNLNSAYEGPKDYVSVKMRMYLRIIVIIWL